MKKILAAVLSTSILLGGLVGCSAPTAPTTTKPDTTGSTATYPTKSITMLIPYGAGGTTDLVGRQFAIALEKSLGQSITIVNQPGASGSVAAQAALAATPDGYTIYFTADSLGSVRVLDVSPLSYHDFSPIMTVANDPKVIVVGKDSKYETIEQLVADLQDNPNTVKMSYTGPGGSGHLQSLIYNKAGMEAALTAYSGGAECTVAVLGGQVAFTNANYSTVASYIESGDLKVLAASSTTRLPSLPDVPALSEVVPEIEEYLDIPFTPLTLLVSPEVPTDVQAILRDAALEASADADFNTYMENNSVDKLYEKYTTLDEIETFLYDWESLVSWMMYDAGATVHSPADFDIPQP